jgi:DNA-binding transcriptional ArsR family regulator
MTPAALPPSLARKPLARIRHTPVDLRVVSDPDQARSLLDPARRAILWQLREPGSSSSVAQRLELPRQRVNYHVRELEKEGLLRHLEDRRRGNCVERIMQAVALRFLLDPGIPGGTAPLPLVEGEERDPFSSSTLRETAIRTLDEVRGLEEWSQTEGKRPPILSLATKVHFRSPAREVEFAREMQRLLDEVGARYHEPDAIGGRDFRVSITGYLVPSLSTSGSDKAEKEGD